MIIILEGPDGSGKSHLAEQLSRQTGYPIVHMDKPKTEEEKERMFGEYLTQVRAGKNFIFDRCWYSEMVYGPIMRKESHISMAQMYELEKQLAKTGAMIIYCTGQPAKLWQRCTKRGEDFITNRETFNAICKEFDAIMLGVPHYVPVTRYTYEEV